MFVVDFTEAKRCKPTPGPKPQDKNAEELTELRTLNESHVTCIKELQGIIIDYDNANRSLKRELEEEGIAQLKRQLAEQEAEIEERDTALLQYHDHAQVCLSRGDTQYSRLVLCKAR